MLNLVKGLLTASIHQAHYCSPSSWEIPGCGTWRAAGETSLWKGTISLTNRQFTIPRRWQSSIFKSKELLFEPWVGFFFNERLAFSTWETDILVTMAIILHVANEGTKTSWLALLLKNRQLRYSQACIAQSQSSGAVQGE